jgi:virginiamycin B lyase
MRLKTILLVATMVAVIIGSWFTAVPPAATSSDASAATSFMVEYPIPAAVGSAPFNLVAEAPGRLWFTMPAANAIGSLVVTSTVDYHFTRYTVPTANSEPYDLAYANNTIWFTQKAGNKIGRLNTLNGVITEYVIPTANSAPTGIDVAPNGMVWFAQRNGNKFGRLDPGSGAIEEFTYDGANAQFEQLVVQSDNIVWASAPNLDLLVSWEFVGDEEVFFSVGTGSGSQPYGITMGGSAPWITARGSNLVGRYMPGTLTLWRWYAPATANSGLAGLAYRSGAGANRTWFAQQNVNKVALLVTESTGRTLLTWEQPLPTAYSQPHGVVVDAAGDVWITAVGSHRIVQWQAPYVDLKQVYLPVVLRQ